MYICLQALYHMEGLAMRLGLGRVLVRVGEPEGDEPSVSRAGSNSSMSSTSSCSSTSWSNMHLTEYWPNAQSCKDQEQSKKGNRCIENTTEELVLASESFLVSILVPTSSCSNLRVVVTG